MSEISLYPQGIDIFTTKVDSTNGDDGDYIMAEHMNRVQNAVTAIELALGTNPQGDSTDVTQRLYSLSKSKALAVPRIGLYSGDPLNVNGCSAKEAAARYFSYLNIALLDGINPFGAVMLNARDVIEETGKIGATIFYGTVDAGVSTSNLTVSDIGTIIDRWKDIGVKGIHFSNFGYASLVSRERQNALIDLAHEKDMAVIVSAANIDHVFSVDNITGMNPGNIPTSLESGDGYVFFGYAVQGLYYENSAELQTLSQKMIDYRSAHGVSMYGIGYIAGSDAVAIDRMYYYGQVVAMMFSLDGFHVMTSPATANTIHMHKTLPIVGGYYDAVPSIRTNGNTISRIAGVGAIEIDLANHTYSFKNIKIPLGLIDFDADDSTINAARLSGNLPESVGIDVIGRINSDPSATISADKVDVDGEKVISSINAIAAGPLKISSEAISELSTTHIEDIVIQVLGEQLQAELLSGDLDANFRRLMAQFISAQNAYFTTIKAETGSFTGLDAGVLTAGYLSSDLIATNTIASDKLTIHANGGVNKWTGTIVLKNPGVVADPGEANVIGKDVYRKFEAVDSATLVTSDYIGSALGNYIVLWETNVFCTDEFVLSSNLTANSHAKIVVNGQVIASVTPNGNVPYSAILFNGWNTIQVYQDHNTETSCTCGIGIKLTQYALQTETGKDANGDPAAPTPISRVDAYSARTTQITGDLLKTGTVDADKIKANSITANQIAANAITADELAANSVTAGKIAADAVTAGAIAADAVRAGNVDANAITAREIASNAITAEKIAADAVTAGKIDADAITAREIAADAVTAEQIAADAVTAGKIDADAITSREIQANAITAEELAADSVTAGKIDANAISARELQADAVTAGKIAADAIASREISAEAITADKIDAEAVTAEKIAAEAVTAEKIHAGAVTADKIAANSITTDKLDANEVSAGLVDAGMVKAIEAYIEHLTATDGEFETLLSELLSSKFIDTSNIKVVSEARDGLDTGALVIDNGGMIVSSTPKDNVAVSNEVMHVVSGRTYRVDPKYVGMPICETPAPVFSLRDTSTLAVTQIPRDSYALIYEYGQISIDESVSLVGKEVIASYSYPEQYYPTGSRIVKIDREGIKISNDGGRPGTWQTKLDGARLYVGEADISDASITSAHIKEGAIQTANIGDAQITSAKIGTAQIGNAHIADVSADKLTAGTIDAAEIDVINLDASNIRTGTLTATESMQIQGGNVSLSNTGLSVSGGAGITVTTIGGKTITLDEDGLISDNFRIEADGDVIITGQISASTGAIGGWTVGANTISSASNKIVLDSSVPSINVDSGKVILGLYDGTHYGIKAVAGLIGNMSIDASGIVVGASGRITDSTTSSKWQLDSTGITAIAGYFGGASNRIAIDGSGLVIGTGRIVDRTSNPLISLDANGIVAQQGYFGSASNRLTLDSQGFVLGTGSIVDTRNAETQRLKIDSAGIVAQAGKIGGLDITTEGIKAIVSGELEQFKLTQQTISLSGNEALTINTGTMVVKDNGTTYVTVGKLASSVYGMKVDLATAGRYVQLDQNGLRAYNGTENTLNVGSDGNISIKGTINATAGTLGGLTVNGTITAGDVTINTTGISGTGYSLNASGLTATAGSIAGWTIGATAISKGTLTIDSANEKITTTGAILGQYAAGQYGIKADSGKIGGWTIASNALSTPNISIESDTELIDIASQVLIGKYDTVTPKYGIKAGDVVLDSTGLYGTGYSLNASGVTATAGSIGGWAITSTLIRNSDSSFILDSANGALKLATNKIVLNKDGSATIGKFSVAATGAISAGSNFSIDASGNLTISGAITATSGTFNGTVNATAGWFGTSTNHVSISGNGLAAGSVVIDNAGIKIGTTLTLDANGLTIANGSSSSINLGGKFIANSTGITAIAGTIGGWTLGDSTLTSGNITLDSTTNSQKISIGTNIVLNNNGSATIGKLSVAADGSISTGAGFSVGTDGKITATQGAIGGWTIGSTDISDGNIHIDSSNNAIWIGSGTYAASLLKLNADGSATLGKFAVAANGSISTGGGFSVATDGKITATGGTVGGFTLGASTIYANTNSVILDATGYKLTFNNSAAIFGQYVANKYGMKVGNFVINGTDSQMYVGADYASSSFKIDLATGNATLANATLTSATISGGITATTGKIGNWTIGTNTLTAGTITLDATASSEKIKVTKTGDATKYVQIDGTGLNVVGGVVNIVTGISGTDNVTIDSTGIRAGNATNYAKLDSAGLTVAGGLIQITTAVSGAKKLEIKSTGIVATKDANNRVEIDGDGVRVIKNGNVLGSAITPDGIIGQLLTDQSIVGTKFDKVAPAVPANVTATSAVEQTATSEFINITVSWNAVTDTDNDLAGYKVYLKEGAGNYYPQAVVQKTSTSYVIRNVKGNVAYTVGVTSYDLTGNESAMGASSQFTTTKDTLAPKDVDVNNLTIVNGIKMFYIKWNPVTQNTNNSTCTDIDYYEVERSEQGSGTWTPVNKTYSTSIIDKDVSYDIYYIYRIRAVDLSGNTSNWVQKDAGTASRVGSADIVAGSITAEVLNVGSMVKNINPNRTMLFHFDGVTTSTQDARPVLIEGGAWTDGKFGDSIALEEATTNIISAQTQGNSNFKNGTTGWTVNNAEYKTTGGVGGVSDGYVEVNSANKISINVTGLTQNTAYTLSLYTKLADFTQITDLVVNKGGAQVVRTTARGDWSRVVYSFTTGAGVTSAAFEFTSIDARKVGVDNIQLEQRSFATAYAESYSLPGGVRAEGKLQYTSERLNSKQGIVSFWYKPNRNGRSPSTSGRILFMWGADGQDQIKLELDDTNKPKMTIISHGVTKTLTHQDAIDSSNWNLLTFRYNCDTTTQAATRYMDIFLNGTPIDEAARVDLSTLQIPAIANMYFTVGNHNSGSYSANGYFDELKIDLMTNMDEQEFQEIISWYKQGSTFYDASSQIDADSQGISAANARVTINAEGINIKDGLLRITSKDGVTLLTGDRINVNGINVGVVQSENEIYNGNFSSIDTRFGMGDMYVTMDGLVNHGARHWRSRRSSAYNYANAIMNAVWGRALVKSTFDFASIEEMLRTGYTAGVNANEAATHQIELQILPAMAAQGVAAVTAAPTSVGASSVNVNTILWAPGTTVYVDGGANREQAVIAGMVPPYTISFATPLTKAHNAGVTIVDKTLFDDTLADEINYQIDKKTEDKFNEWWNFGIGVIRYNDMTGNTKYIGAKYDEENNQLLYIPAKLDQWTGKFSVDYDPVTLLPKTMEATEELGVYGHTKYEVWPTDSKYGKTGYARLGVDTLEGKPRTDVLGVGNGSNAVFTITNPAIIAAVALVTVNGTPKIAGVQYNLDATRHVITFTVGNIPAAGQAVTATYNTVDTSAQTVSIEQDLMNLVTYTDGLLPEDTNWRQHAFTFYAKWDGPVVETAPGSGKYVPIDPITGTPSSAELYLEVDEMLPPYTIDSETGEAIVQPAYKMRSPDMYTLNGTDFAPMNTQNDFILLNTDYTEARNAVMLGHATWNDPGTYKSYTLDSIRYGYLLPAMKIRYIRDWTNGNNVDGNNHWANVTVLDYAGQPVVINPANIKDAAGNAVTNAANIVDIIGGNPNIGTYATINGTGSPTYIQIDLGQVYAMDLTTHIGGIGAIVVHHIAGRTYHNTRLQVSEDGVKWYDIWNSDSTGWYTSGSNGEYTEQATGRTIGGSMSLPIPPYVTAKPIIVEEIFTSTGETADGKPKWTIMKDGTSVLDPKTGLYMDHSSYLSSTCTGDVMVLMSTNDAYGDVTLNLVKDRTCGDSSIFIDGAFFGMVDPSYATPIIDPSTSKNLEPGRHMITAVTTGTTGFNTMPLDQLYALGYEAPTFKIDSGDWYDWRLTDSKFTTSVEYEETDSVGWNKIVIKPKQTNDKSIGNGTPQVTIPNVPVKYRARVRLVKGAGDPISVNAVVTALQAELGQNESYTRVNYGKGGLPTYMIENYVQGIPLSGITSQQLQEFYGDTYGFETGVRERHLADGAVTTSKIMSAAITGDKLAVQSITPTRLARIPNEKLRMNLSHSDYEYPLLPAMMTNVNPAVRYIAAQIDDSGSEEIYLNGQRVFEGDDYTIEYDVLAAQHTDPTTTPATVLNAYATKITFTRTVSATDSVRATYWLKEV